VQNNQIVSMTTTVEYENC